MNEGISQQVANSPLPLWERSAAGRVRGTSRTALNWPPLSPRVDIDRAGRVRGGVDGRWINKYIIHSLISTLYDPNIPLTRSSSDLSHKGRGVIIYRNHATFLRPSFSSMSFLILAASRRPTARPRS
jgi:hypothetical protein